MFMIGLTIFIVGVVTVFAVGAVICVIDGISQLFGTIRFLVSRRRNGLGLSFTSASG